MKCPVCKKEFKETDKACPTCSFTELNVEFLNAEEGEQWHRAVVMPARALWNATQKMYEKALKEQRAIEKKVADLKAQYEALYTDYEALRKSFDALQPLNPRVPATETKRMSGWNTSGGIAHPNFASCSYFGTRLELTNISSVREDNEVTVTFMAKKVYDKGGNTSTEDIGFRYKVKDPTGVIVESEIWIAEGLMVNDVMKGEIYIDDITSNGYSIEFFDS